MWPVWRLSCAGCHINCGRTHRTFAASIVVDAAVHEATQSYATATCEPSKCAHFAEQRESTMRASTQAGVNVRAVLLAQTFTVAAGRAAHAVRPYLPEIAMRGAVRRSTRLRLPRPSHEQGGASRDATTFRFPQLLS